MKKFLSGVLAVVLLLSVAITPVSAADSIQEQTYQNILSALNIMNGYADGTFGLNNTLTRAEFAKLAIKASSLKDSVPDSVYYSPFSDVSYTYWAAPYISTAASAGYMVGYSGGSFKPGQNVKLEEAVTTVLRLLGYTSTDFTGAYPDPQLSLANNLGLLKNVTAKKGTAITRRDAMYLFYNLLQASTKSGTKYITTFGFTSVDYGTIIDSSMTGPITVKSVTWYASTGLRETGIKVYRDGKLISLSDISIYNIVYYSTGMNTVWVYNTQVTGLYEKALPDQSYPTSVTVAGNTYTFETTEAAGTMSSFGSYKVGDTVTLLLGKNGAIADVVPLTNGSTTLYGIVSAAGTTNYTDSAGTPYAGYYATVFLSDGSTATYHAQSDYSSSVGKVVSVKFVDSKVTLATQSSTAVTGTVSVSGNRIGSSVIGENIKVVEVVDDVPHSVYISRLDGINLTDDDVLYAATDGGVVTALFISDVTGDTLSYGMLTTFTENDTGNLSGSYTFDISGTTSTKTTSGMIFGVSSTGPCVITYDSDGKTLSAIKRLTKLNYTVSSLDATKLVTESGTTYLLADKTSYYVKTGESYQYSTLSAVLSSGYTIKAYYDKAQQLGGRIRIIVAG